MTGKVIDRETTGFLVLIIPIAIAAVVLFTAWKWILLLIGLTIVWNIWRSYQWLKWSEKVNPFFTQLVRENQGCVTPMDLSLKANLNGRSAKKFLDRKAEEFGAQRKPIEDGGIVYYFLTASVLGKIFDDSEPALEAIPSTNPTLPTPKTATPSTSSFLGQLLGVDEADTGTEPVSSPSPVVEETVDETPQVHATEETKTPSQENLTLIQSELAKRLDTNPSTIGRRKSSSDFAQWSRSKDPDGIAWKYVSKTQLFVPVEDK